MEYKINEQKDSIIVSLQGSFTFSDGSSFRNILQSIERSSDAKIIFDLAQLEFIDSSALGMLLLMREKQGEKSSNTILRHPQGQVLKIFELSEFGTLFQLEH